MKDFIKKKKKQEDSMSQMSVTLYRRVESNGVRFCKTLRVDIRKRLALNQVLIDATNDK
ncbi:hypothetical protein ACJJID_01570 [Microbulbifer sp. CnH-101-G]|uniref:hypothetical protein n=1 Tax=Microbulbifer sp. CnH-101-G TaxID=3243393 RepID=UPI0040393533